MRRLLWLLSLLSLLAVVGCPSPRGGGGDDDDDDDDDSASDDDDATGDDDDSGDDDDATGDDDDATGDDDDATGDDDDATGDDDDATGDDDDATGDDDDSTVGDDDDATGDDDDATGDDDDSTVGDDDDSTTSNWTEPCTVAAEAQLVVVPTLPATTTVPLDTTGQVLSQALSCSLGGTGNNAVIEITAALPNQVAIAFDHTGGDVQYQLFDAFGGTCAPVQLTYNTTTGDCMDNYPDVTGTMTFTPTGSFGGSYRLVLSAYEAGVEVPVDITVTQ